MSCLVQARTRESVHNTALQLTETLSRTLCMEFDQALQWPAENNRADSKSLVKTRPFAILFRLRASVCASGPVFELGKPFQCLFDHPRRAQLRRHNLDGRQPVEITLAVLMRPFSVEWREQIDVNFFFRTVRSLGASPIPEFMAKEAPAVLP